MEGASICPPKPEDAGLEDCALPPEAIQEAFLKAADFVRSRFVSDGEDDVGDDADDGGGCCMGVPGPGNEGAPDTLLDSGVLPWKQLYGDVRHKGSVLMGEESWVKGDVVVVTGEGGPSTDKVVVFGEEALVGSVKWEKKANFSDNSQKGDEEEKNGIGEVERS